MVRFGPEFFAAFNDFGLVVTKRVLKLNFEKIDNCDNATSGMVSVECIKYRRFIGSVIS